MNEELDREDVEKYLQFATRNVLEEHRTTGPADVCAKMVEKINAELLDKCSSVENYKYVVHATVQVNLNSRTDPHDEPLIFTGPKIEILKKICQNFKNIV